MATAGSISRPRAPVVTAEACDWALGDGTIRSDAPVRDGEGPIAIASADLDGDGHPDLIAANDSLNTLSVLLGNGDGTFRPKVDYDVTYRPEAIATGDLNGDGHPDVVDDIRCAVRTPRRR